MCSAAMSLDYAGSAAMETTSVEPLQWTLRRRQRSNGNDNAGNAAKEATSLAALQGKTRSLTVVSPAALLADLTGSDLTAWERPYQWQWRICCCCSENKCCEFTVVEVEVDVSCCCCHFIFPREFRESPGIFLYFDVDRNIIHV